MVDYKIGHRANKVHGSIDVTMQQHTTYISIYTLDCLG